MTNTRGEIRECFHHPRHMRILGYIPTPQTQPPGDFWMCLSKLGPHLSQKSQFAVVVRQQLVGHGTVATLARASVNSPEFSGNSSLRIVALNSAEHEYCLSWSSSALVRRISLSVVRKHVSGIAGDGQGCPSYSERAGLINRDLLILQSPRTRRDSRSRRVAGSSKPKRTKPRDTIARHCVPSRSLLLLRPLTQLVWLAEPNCWRELAGPR